MQNNIVPLDRDSKLILLRSIQQGFIDLNADSKFWERITKEQDSLFLGEPIPQTRLEYEALVKRLTE